MIHDIALSSSDSFKAENVFSILLSRGPNLVYFTLLHEDVSSPL